MQAILFRPQWVSQKQIWGTNVMCLLQYWDISPIFFRMPCLSMCHVEISQARALVGVTDLLASVWLTQIHMEMHGCIKHQAISSHSIDFVFILLPKLHFDIVYLYTPNNMNRVVKVGIIANLFSGCVSCKTCCIGCWSWSNQHVSCWWPTGARASATTVLLTTCIWVGFNPFYMGTGM